MPVCRSPFLTLTLSLSLSLIIINMISWIVFRVFVFEFKLILGNHLLIRGQFLLCLLLMCDYLIIFPFYFVLYATPHSTNCYCRWCFSSFDTPCANIPVSYFLYHIIPIKFGSLIFLAHEWFVRCDEKGKICFVGRWHSQKSRIKKKKSAKTERKEIN